MIKKGTYKFIGEFLPMIEVSIGVWKRRKEEFKEWLSEFYDYELIEDRPIMIEIKEVYGEYKPMPRKKITQFSTEQKIKDYEEFTIKALGKEFKPNSKSKVAREAIADFGNSKYHHTNQRAVAQRYVGPAFEKYGETDGSHIWVWYDTYEPLSDKDVTAWRAILKKHKIAEEEAANAFYKASRGEDITKEKTYYKEALDEFKIMKGDKPILVSNWRESL